jgi:hypothetical protein
VPENAGDISLNQTTTYHHQGNFIFYKKEKVFGEKTVELFEATENKLSWWCGGVVET